MLEAAKVLRLWTDSSYRPEEVPDGETPADAVLVEGIVHKFAFHPTRVAAHTQEIAALVDDLPPQFRRSGGGGWSFLNLCLDKRGAQWGEHSTCEALLVLAIATGQGGYLMPRGAWGALPGGMPYVWLGE